MSFIKVTKAVLGYCNHVYYCTFKRSMGHYYSLILPCALFSLRRWPCEINQPKLMQGLSKSSAIVSCTVLQQIESSNLCTLSNYICFFIFFLTVNVFLVVQLDTWNEKMLHIPTNGNTVVGGSNVVIQITPEALIEYNI